MHRTNPEPDQRRDERYRPETRLELVTDDGMIVPVTLTNISLHGFSVGHASPLGVGCEVMVRLDDGTTNAARVVWVTQDAMGCELATPIDEDQLSQLRYDIVA